ncbi:MAG: ATP-dependent RecD-like DNA helicase [Bacilli bacterium]
MNTYIKGQFKKNIFKSETGYVIGLFKVKETNEDELNIYVNRIITFTGYFNELNEIDTYIFYGKLITHEKYGEQFNVEKYEKVLPEEKDSIIAFLTSGIFKGIGEKKALKIFNVLGKDTLNIIIENPTNLLLIPGITEKNVQELHTKLIEYESSYQSILQLTDLGFSTKDSILVYNKYGSKTFEIIEENIYIIYEDIKDITFKKIDYIALKNNIEKDDIRRVSATIIYVFNEIYNVVGHSYLYKEEIYNYVIRIIPGLDKEIYNCALDLLIKNIKIVNKEDRYYLLSMYEAERNISQRLFYLQTKKVTKDKNIDDYIEKLQKNFGVIYNDEQKLGIKTALLKNILVITGGPGTGKTTIIKAICEAYRLKYKLTQDDLVKEIALLAPTGRASKRLMETTYIKASTIHRFLKWNKDTDTYQVNERNKSDVKLVIIDETSMLDTYLFDNLLKGLKIDTKIILVGDYDQLPSVGPGQVLKDIIESNVINVIKLDKLYRQKENSNIITLAYNIKNELIETDIFNKEKDLTFIPCQAELVKDNIIKVLEDLNKKEKEHLQVLAPMYKTKNGIDELNVLLQEYFNKKKDNKREIVVNQIVYREKDKVMQLTNMPDDNVFNGDIGIITKINNENKKEIYVDFDGNIVKYTPANFNSITHGYAISIHKSQGSEFDVVILPLVKNYNKMLYKKLIYTAVTRCKKRLFLIGDINALEYAVQNNNTNIRKTSICEMLKKEFLSE